MLKYIEIYDFGWKWMQRFHHSSKEKLLLVKYFFKQSYLNRKVALNGDFR